MGSRPSIRGKPDLHSSTRPRTGAARHRRLGLIPFLGAALMMALGPFPAATAAASAPPLPAPQGAVLQAGLAYHVTGPPYQLGTLTVTQTGGACHDDFTCVKFTLSCPGDLQASIGGTIAHAGPTAGTPRGLGLFFSGGPGKQFWTLHEKGKPADPEKGTEAIKSSMEVANDLRTQGIGIAEVAWNSAWMEAQPGEQIGISHTSCRPATAIRWVFENLYIPMAVSPGSAGVCGFCIGGGSGGSSAVALSLAFYPIDTFVDGVFPFAGPPHAAIDKGCNDQDPEFPIYEYPATSPSTRQIDSPWGYPAGGGPCEMKLVGFEEDRALWIERWRNDGADAPAADHDHDRTRVHLINGENDASRRHWEDYFETLTAGNNPMVTLQKIPKGGHGLFSTAEGPLALEAAVLWNGGPEPFWNGAPEAPPAPACSNGIDDDHDGLADGLDPGCESGSDTSEHDPAGPECDDGIDNDLDGRTDYRVDAYGDTGCEGPTDDMEEVPDCGDLIDNDGDGLIDHPNDPGCASPEDTTETNPAVACDDGIDNDGDGLIDFRTSGGDPGCESPTDTTETNPDVECDDGVDNDGDLKIDYRPDGSGDPDCEGPLDDSEAPPPSAVTISVDDPAPKAEGNSGTSLINFTVSLSAPADSLVRVKYTTADGTATAGQDYAEVSKGIRFNPGQTSKTVGVTIFGDTAVEPDETFTLNLSNPQGASISKAQGVATIVNDDGGDPPPPPPGDITISVNDISKTEGNSRQTRFTFTVTLSSPPPSDVTVDYATADGTAVAGEDYTSPAPGTLTFSAATGQTTKTVDVAVKGDTVVEPDETFLLNLSNPQGATISKTPGVATILNDDGVGGGSSEGVKVSIKPKVKVIEGDEGSSPARLPVTLSEEAEETIVVPFHTVDGTATAPGDHEETSGELVFPPGALRRVTDVLVHGDLDVEGDESFTVVLDQPENAVLDTAEGLVVIAGDDGAGSASGRGPAQRL